MPLRSKKKYNLPLNLSDGIITVYAQIVGSKDKRTIKLALDTGASYTMIPHEKVLATGHNIPLGQNTQQEYLQQVVLNMYHL